MRSNDTDAFYRVPYEYYIRYLITLGVTELKDINSRLRFVLCPATTEAYLDYLMTSIGVCPVPEKRRRVTDIKYRKWLAEVGVLNLHIPNKNSRIVKRVATESAFWRAFVPHGFYYLQTKNSNIEASIKNSLLKHRYVISIDAVRIFIHFFWNHTIMSDHEWFRFREISPYTRQIVIGLGKHGDDPLMLDRSLGNVGLINPTDTMKMMMGELHTAFLEVSDIPVTLSNISANMNGIDARRKIAQTWLAVHNEFVDANVGQEDVGEELGRFLELNEAPSTLRLDEVRSQGYIPQAVEEDRLLLAGQLYTKDPTNEHEIDDI